MPCYHSKPAWEMPNLELLEQGIKDVKIRFSPPKLYREPDYYLPCGKCLGCKARQKQDWGTRIFHEAQLHERNAFVTFTYDDHHYPKDGKISKKDIRNAIRRIQRDQEKRGYPVRYYACGEYGENTGRAHYHAVFFGDDFRGSRYTYDLGNNNYGNKELERVWGKGQVTLSEITPERAFYTAGYVTKKMGDEAQDTFAIQSRRPPIGKDWLRKYYKSMAKIGGIIINGHKHTIPKVYSEWLKGTDEYYEIKALVREQQKAMCDKQLQDKKLNYLAKQNLRSFKI